MDVQRAGIDIGALRELEVFLLVEAFRISELERMLVLGALSGTTGWHFPVTRRARLRAGHIQSWHGEQQ